MYLNVWAKNSLQTLIYDGLPKSLVILNQTHELSAVLTFVVILCKLACRQDERPYSWVIRAFVKLY